MASGDEERPEPAGTQTPRGRAPPAERTNVPISVRLDRLPSPHTSHAGRSSPSAARGPASDSTDSQAIGWTLDPQAPDFQPNQAWTGLTLRRPNDPVNVAGAAPLREIDAIRLRGNEHQPTADQMPEAEHAPPVDRRRAADSAARHLAIAWKRFIAADLEENAQRVEELGNELFGQEVFSEEQAWVLQNTDNDTETTISQGDVPEDLQ